MAVKVKKETKKTTKKVAAKKAPAKKPVAKKAALKACKPVKVTVAEVKVPETKKSFWTKVAEFFGF